MATISQSASPWVVTDIYGGILPVEPYSAVSPRESVSYNADRFIYASVGRIGSLRRPASVPSPHRHASSHSRWRRVWDRAREEGSAVGLGVSGEWEEREMWERGKMTSRRWSGWTTYDEKGAVVRPIQAPRLLITALSTESSSSEHRRQRLLRALRCVRRGIARFPPAPSAATHPHLFCVLLARAFPVLASFSHGLCAVRGRALRGRRSPGGTKREGEAARHLRGSLIVPPILYSSRGAALTEHHERTGMGGGSEGDESGCATLSGCRRPGPHHP
ncbi:hypothetical protein MVEN_01610400 [Mycena venus]|uniref:Uncharacterized protein n=1 Tax=Mycena venus TaxID=2733690 RepID=A0A8H6XSE1_9AGAR|nr:hypothetical protein MVEN_01610400 [Mycena venus]